jgi:hypothetical protein
VVKLPVFADGANLVDIRQTMRQVILVIESKVAVAIPKLSPHPNQTSRPVRLYLGIESTSNYPVSKNINVSRVCLDSACLISSLPVGPCTHAVTFFGLPRFFGSTDRRLRFGSRASTSPNCAMMVRLMAVSTTLRT